MSARKSTPEPVWISRALLDAIHHELVEQYGGAHGVMSDALLAQSAVDRLTSGAHRLVIEGPSYRQRDSLQRAAVDTASEAL